ncbi:D-alanyl-D-alanine carboxypeptidase/D-alanyl-D-alanine-endopeptidase [Aliifodinibius sp. S!AR15-10]|uniref:D-alanyl-D-alanine carboxypeptidase/D-alanyl-D-alanine endopeptidase n=1 Tax=Aliifodinibius sp. S!AR15-10 TaxID=2950437 RepID=UPI002862AAFC|nr:D-alanyl-D-alanine carboxypeptidase/D-alanyl-D-alanine-endopeptidase [Aliifodinibius sp. S!AR15-10]MDR8390393.1 D-alanyl-D-alanine carboxypeptidase/D-alanyl-D-alanine-endopeptidase [Aliifodinibius sp. S!AR15-10]
MERINISLRIFLFTVCLLFFNAGTASSQQILPDLKATINQSRANDAFWSIAVKDSTGQLLEGYHHDKLVRPASNLKLLTSAAILDQLGSDFQYNTYIYGVGSQEGETWKGDLIIRGSGDPSISGRFYEEYRFHVFEEFVNQLDSLGIRRVEGNLIGNDSYFDQQPYPKGWSWEDLSFYYGVEISALSFNNNAVDLEVFADGEVGSAPRIQWFPFDTDYVEFLNDQTISPGSTEYDEFYRRMPGTNTIMLGSRLPKGYFEEESLSVLNASHFFMDTFRKYLEKSGIDIAGQIIVDNQLRDWDSERFQVLAEHRSKPLAVLLNEVNTESSNFYTEMMLKTAAAEKYGTQGSTELGISLVREFAHSMGMDTTDVEMSDGSGMASSTLLTPNDLTEFLVRMQAHPEFHSYQKSLAIAGFNGTLKHRFRGTPLEDNVSGKTGYVSGVRSLSGYMTSSSGQKVIFSIYTNNYTNKTSYIDRLHQQLLMQIYQAY